MNYLILKAESRHLPHLPGIEDAAGELVPVEDRPEPPGWSNLPPEAFEIASGRDLLWVVVEEDAGIPIAFLMADVVDSCMHIVEFDVHPRHGRRGVGSNLLNHVLDTARQRGFHAATLTTFGHLAWNAPYYVRLGFESVGADQIGRGLAQWLEKEQALGMRRPVAMKLELQPDNAPSSRSSRFSAPDAP